MYRCEKLTLRSCAHRSTFMKMPVMDGWTFSSELRSRHGNRVPLVVMTAAADARMRARELGASAWLGKPFDLDDMLSTVARNVSHS